MARLGILVYCNVWKKIHYASTELDQMSKHATLKRLKFQIYDLFQSYGRGQYFWFVFFT